MHAETPELGLSHPHDLDCIVAGTRYARQIAGPNVVRHVVKAHPTSVIAVDPVVHLDCLQGLDIDTGFLSHLTSDGLKHCFTQLDPAARELPETLVWLSATLDEQKAPFVHDVCAATRRRTKWELR